MAALSLKHERTDRLELGTQYQLILQHTPHLAIRETNSYPLAQRASATCHGGLPLLEQNAIRAGRFLHCEHIPTTQQLQPTSPNLVRQPVLLQSQDRARENKTAQKPFTTKSPSAQILLECHAKCLAKNKPLCFQQQCCKA